MFLFLYTIASHTGEGLGKGRGGNNEGHEGGSQSDEGIEQGRRRPNLLSKLPVGADVSGNPIYND